MQNPGRKELVPFLHEVLPFEQPRGLGQSSCLLKFIFLAENYFMIFISTHIKVATYNTRKKKKKNQCY